MFGNAYGRAAAYSKMQVETGVTDANPHKLVLMLYDGAILSITTASVSMEAKKIAAKGEAISKAIEILSNGLKVSLDMEKGGELAERLAALYDYMADRLIYANLHNNRQALDEVLGLLHSLREAWEQIGTPAPQTTAPSDAPPGRASGDMGSYGGDAPARASIRYTA